MTRRDVGGRLVEMRFVDTQGGEVAHTHLDITN